jgi:electron transport complex protein RnfE
LNKLDLLKNGIIKENPVLVLLLGTCPTLAVTTMAINGLGMGVATMLVLICSNIVISLLKNIIPDQVRIPCYIVVIAGFVTIVGFLLKAYAPALDQALGIFIPLIVVNCIILGRAEMFAAKNSIVNSALDGVGMGLGFTLALFLMGSIREILGSGAWMGITLTADVIQPMSIFMLAPGGFFVYGCLVAFVNQISHGKAIKKKEMGCAGCPSASICTNAEEGGGNK